MITDTTRTIAAKRPAADSVDRPEGPHDPALLVPFLGIDGIVANMKQRADVFNLAIKRLKGAEVELKSKDEQLAA